MSNVVVEFLAVVALTHHLHLAASGRHALPSTVLELAYSVDLEGFVGQTELRVEMRSANFAYLGVGASLRKMDGFDIWFR
jgi:hypothetical protein